MIIATAFVIVGSAIIGGLFIASLLIGMGLSGEDMEMLASFVMGFAIGWVGTALFLFFLNR